MKVFSSSDSAMVFESFAWIREQFQGNLKTTQTSASGQTAVFVYGLSIDEDYVNALYIDKFNYRIILFKNIFTLYMLFLLSASDVYF
jgi:hypothetical protein